MTIVVTGGGSGGHITPVLAVADELKKQFQGVRIVYIIQKGDKLIDVPSSHPSIDRVYTIRAGKFRRYHGEGLKQLLDVPTILKNLRDLIFVGMGLWQSYWLLKKLKPAGIFCKGGFVVVPVGLAAAAQGIPYVTHDSDSIPGLANRLIARWAKAHATGMPKELYPYPQEMSFYTGIPLSSLFKTVSVHEQTKFKEYMGVPKDHKVVLITGGGLGAQRVNEAVIVIARELLSDESEVTLVHIAGRANEEAVRAAYDAVLPEGQRGRVMVKGFITDLYRYSGAADVIIARAGATAIAEFAQQQKACIVIPNPLLTGGHQLKNAQYWQEQGAIELVTEEELQTNPGLLLQAVRDLLDNDTRRQEIGTKLSAFAHPKAAEQLAELMKQVIQENKN